MRLADVIGRFVGKVEIVLAGADSDLREGEIALASGDAMSARAAAHRVLERAPQSPLGLALLADACDAGNLDAELAMTLEELALRAPSRAEVWVRLGHARAATQADIDDVRDAFVRALAVADAGSDARREALIGLTDLDLANGDGARAELWLERAAGDHSSDLEVRRAEARLSRGDAPGAAKILDEVPTQVIDGRAALVRGRALAELGDAAAFLPLARAMVLDAKGASDALCSALARLPSDAQVRTRVRSIVDAKGEQNMARWRAAFARAEGARDAARQALYEAVLSGDPGSARPLLDAALEDRDASALSAALAILSGDDDDGEIADARKLSTALSLHGAAALDAVAPVVHTRQAAWADVLVAEIARAWIPASGVPSSWTDVLARLDRHAHAIGGFEAAARLADLATDRSRPVRLAVVGEFNAGKSTFINAFIGTDVAPTGVLPTTATLHHLRWAPDPFAKILFSPGVEPRERIVALTELRATLASLDTEHIAEVEIRLPLPALVRVEILDTPGFNAPDRRHAEIARAAFEQADIAIWLFDATQSLKDSERQVLEQAERARLPVQMLVNKADRLGADDLAHVMANLRTALEEAHLETWAPPVALSAKKALAGRLGNAEALRESGWEATQRLFDESIVARTDELKERAMRRRAAAVVGDLDRAFRVRVAAEADDVRALGARATAAAHAAGQIEGDAEALGAKLAISLAPHAKAWARDVEIVFVGRDREAAVDDPVLIRFRIDRALAALGAPLSQALAALAPEGAVTPAQMLPYVRAMVRAAASSVRPDEHGRGLLAALARASVPMLAEFLFSKSVFSPPQTRAAGVVRELAAIAVALG